jgi:diacylglycerol kinase
MSRALKESLGLAFKGLAHVFRTQRNIIIQHYIMIFVIVLAILLRVSAMEFLFLFLVSIFVIMTEIMNTAIEEIVNLVTPTRRARAMIAKDVAAGAVVTAAILAIVTGLVIFTPYFINLIRQVF